MSAGKVVTVAAAGILALAATIIKPWEGLRTVDYADPIGIPTACYGHTGPGVVIGKRRALPECDALLQKDVAIAYGHVKHCIKVPLKENEAAALTSATYNIGPNIVCNSSLSRLANQGVSPQVWCRQLSRWVYAGGKKLRGLERRRQAEIKVCLGG